MSCNTQTTQPVTFLVPTIRRGQGGLIARLRAWPNRLWQMAERQRQRAAAVLAVSVCLALGGNRP
jgi:hypothetical protein